MDSINASNAEAIFDVFVSYAHEDSNTVNRIVDALHKRGLTVFDPFKQKEQMWGVDLNDWFASVFPAQARAAIIFLSKDYLNSKWCTKELNYVLRSAHENPRSSRVLPISLDESPIPEPAGDLVFLSIKSTSPDEIASLTQKKVAEISDDKVDLALLSDEQLVEKIGDDRDEVAFDLLYKRIYPVIARHVRRSSKLIPDEDQSGSISEIVQQVLIDVWQTASTFRKEEVSFDEWLLHRVRLATGRFTNDRVRQREHEILLPIVPTSGESQLKDDATSDPAVTSDEFQLKNALLALIDKLDNKEQMILKLWAEGLTTSEIAAVLNMSDPVARYELSKNLAKLRNRIRNSMRRSAGKNLVLAED